MERKAGATHQVLHFLQVIHAEVFRLILMISGLRSYKEFISKIHRYIPVFSHCKAKFDQYFSITELYYTKNGSVQRFPPLLSNSSCFLTNSKKPIQ